MKWLLLPLICVWAMTAWADSSDTTQPATIDSRYSGGYKDTFPQELNAVQSYLMSSQSAIATQLGLQYGQGFHHPVTVRFEDGAPRVNENPFYYVLARGAGPDYHQDLVGNVEAYAQDVLVHGHRYSNPAGGFRYAMTEVMLNDMAEGDPDKALPQWLQEGLSVYASGSGEALLKEVTERLPRSRVRELTGGLNNPGPYLTPTEWARYYLAVDFIAARGALQNFVRDMLNGDSSADAVRNTFGYEWPEFETNVRNYSAQKLAGYAPADEDLEHPAARHPRP